MADFHRELERLIPKLGQYAVALTRDRDRARDLVQACLVRALEKRDLWRPGTDLRAWLFAIMHNHFITDRRRAAASPVKTVPTVTEWTRVAGRPAQDDRLMLRDLDRALARLPAEYREVVLLVGLGDANYNDTARRLGVPIGTIKSRLSRARALLREYLQTAGESRAVAAA